MPKVKFSSTAPNDRKDAFEFLCKKHNLDVEKTAEKHGIDNSGPGGSFNVTIEKLFLFLYKEKFAGEFDFKGKEITVHFEEKPVTGKKAVEKPDLIEDNEVDEVEGEEDDDDPELPF